MRPLTNNDIESEISYAYLHAVASHVGAGCHSANRASDGNGIDALLTAWGPFPEGGYLQEVDIKVQLKATTIKPVIENGYISYFLNGIQRYNDLRSEALATHRILVVMFLPPESSDWLNITENELALKKCAYWVSLRGAPESTNASGQTIYIPQTQIFHSNGLKDIFVRRSRGENLNYRLP
ncbi:DUF4365 domain-containing protein [Chitinophaga horti]|uniref:DUF4365 domain-containing protein n=1 Tax=Chitinophaga horti TaxID=2920382 RepID=A0ABY6J868_9BACT|nr:DUF4365 domain-containing protein [Chitinophaga horti]UYQ94344.1 DUF4365 domain-containing protein [Chitinophaga horti]